MDKYKFSQLNQPHIPTTLIASIPISQLDYAQTMDFIQRWVSEKSHRVINICPVHSIIHAKHHYQHKIALLKADLNTSDGMPLVVAKKLLGDPNPTRVYGPTLMLKILEQAPQKKWRIALYGASSHCLDKLKQAIATKFPSVHIVSAISPPYASINAPIHAKYIAQINRAKPDITFVSLGCPKQEAWMAKYSPQLKTILIGVGAAFDFHAGLLKQAPPILQKLSLEWAFRLACEPRRLFKRYASTNPAYLFHITSQLYKHYLLKHNFNALKKQTLGNAPLPKTQNPLLPQTQKRAA